MESSIIFGQYNNSYKYIILLILCLLLKDHLFGFVYNNSLLNLKIFSKGKQEDFSKHTLIHHLFCYFGTFIMGFAFFKIEKKINQNESEKEENKNKSDESGNNSELISINRSERTTINKSDDSKNESNEEKEEPLIHIKPKLIDYSKFPSFKCLMLIFLWIIDEQILENIYDNILKDLDFWMIELIILAFLDKLMNKNKLYIHKKLVLYLNLFPILFKITAITLSFIDDKNKRNDTEPDYHYENGGLKIIYVVHWILVPFGILTYLCLITLRSYVNLSLKWFMDKKYVSENFLLMIYGFLGTIICSIIACIASFKYCEESQIIKNKNDIYDYLCTIQENTNKENYIKKYYENFKVYFINFNTDYKENSIRNWYNYI